MPEDDKSLGSKLLGLFIETDAGRKQPEPSEEGGGSAADLVAELARSSAPQRPVSAPPSPPAAAPPPRPARVEAAPRPAPSLEPQAAPASIDFERIFREVGMDAVDLERVRKAEELLRSLPEATPVAVKRQIVDAALRAFGFDIQRIIAAAQNQLRALDTYVRLNETATAKALQEAEQQIQSLNEQIAQLRADIDKRTRSLAGLDGAAQGRKAEIQKVLDFFQPPPAGPGPTPQP
jgi:hypothetical protein